MPSDLDQLLNRIYTTELCHIRAEKRNRWNEVFFHLSLAAYSACSISISFISKKYAALPTGEALTATSILTFAISLIVYGFKFGETAAKHRDCYLGLQRLRGRKWTSVQKLSDEYINLLAYFPNHNSIDFLNSVVTRPFSRTQDKENSIGNKFTLSFGQVGHYWLDKFLRHVLGTLFALAPVVFFILMFLNVLFSSCVR